MCTGVGFSLALGSSASDPSPAAAARALGASPSTPGFVPPTPGRAATETVALGGGPVRFACFAEASGDAADGRAVSDVLALLHDCAQFWHSFFYSLSDAKDHSVVLLEGAAENARSFRGLARWGTRPFDVASTCADTTRFDDDSSRVGLHLPFRPKTSEIGRDAAEI